MSMLKHLDPFSSLHQPLAQNKTQSSYNDVKDATQSNPFYASYFIFYFLSLNCVLAKLAFLQSSNLLSMLPPPGLCPEHSSPRYSQISCLQFFSERPFLTDLCKIVRIHTIYLFLWETLYLPSKV